MSNTQLAFLQRSAVPERAALQASIDSLGFNLKLHPGFNPFVSSGFLPVTLNGEDGPGFEIYFEDVTEISEMDEMRNAIASGRDHCISMRWGGSMKDLACVMIVSSALARDFNAVVSHEGEAPIPVLALLEGARTVLKIASGEA